MMFANLMCPVGRTPYSLRFLPDSAGKEPTLTYTTGLSARPGYAYELAAAGLTYRLAQYVIPRSIEVLAEADEPAEGLELEGVLTPWRVRLHRVEKPTLFHGSAIGIPVWQVLTPDKWHLFPGDEHYTDESGQWAQPLL
jgi:hypothetical protein